MQLCAETKAPCAKCKNDICPECRAAKREQEKTDISGHPLLYSFESSDYPGGIYSCAKCKNLKKCGNGRWTCKQCKYNECLNCTTPAAPLIVSPVSCFDAKGHALMWTQSFQRYPNHRYTCEKCKKQGQCKGGRWACNICMYNVCPECKLSQERFKTCKNSHPLKWSNDATGYSTPNYTCASCKKQVKPVNSLRWSCNTCSYDICQTCKPPISPNLITPFLEDRAGHKIIWTLSEEKVSLIISLHF